LSVSPTPFTRIRAATLLAIGVLVLGGAAASAQPKSQERLGTPPSSGAAGDATKDDTRIDPGEPLPEITYDIDRLPPKVRSTLSRILGAARSGNLDSMRAVIEENELVPAFSFGDDKDPIVYWKRISRDGEGREMLAEILKVFSSGFVRMDPDTKEELYVWPYHFVYPIDDLTPTQLVELYVLVNPDDARTMVESGGYFGFRGGISPDGTWQYFIAGD
jgi:hypothetical protein